MILHVVLFRPRPDVSRETRRAFVEALAEARVAIPSVRSFWAGRRVADAPAYRISGFPDFPFAAVATFDDRAGLVAYLEHPAHEALSLHLNSTAAAALIYDFEVADPIDRASITRLSEAI